MQLDTLVARGNTSDVYRLGSDAVIKVLHPQIPDDWADREAQIAGRVHAAGLPAPAVLDLTFAGGRPAIIFELIDGPSMWAEMLARHEDIAPLSRILADLQGEVNATPAPPGIPRLTDRLRRKLERNPILSESERNATVDELASHPDDDMLCHFDVHPNNVLMGPAGPVIIDWFDAAAGSPAADVARSSVLMRPDAASCHLPCPDRSVISAVHHEYLTAVLEDRRVDIDQLLGWEPTVLASRMAEPLGEESTQAAVQAWHAGRASRPTPLAVGIAGIETQLSALAVHNDEA